MMFIEQVRPLDRVARYFETALRAPDDIPGIRVAGPICTWICRHVEVIPRRQKSVKVKSEITLPVRVPSGLRFISVRRAAGETGAICADVSKPAGVVPGTRSCAKRTITAESCAEREPAGGEVVDAQRVETFLEWSDYEVLPQSHPKGIANCGSRPLVRARVYSVGSTPVNWSRGSIEVVEESRFVVPS